MRRLAACLAIALLGLGGPAPAAAGADGAITAIQDPAGVRISLALPQSGHPNELPSVEMGGLPWPARLFALDVTGAGSGSRLDALIQLTVVQSAAYDAVPPAAPVRQPYALDERGRLQPRPGLITETQPRLPASPVSVLRASVWRGSHIAVLAVTPIFTQAGALRRATRVEAFVPQARLIDHLPDRSAFAPGPPPANPAVAGLSWTIAVTAHGLQRITGQALASAGLDITHTAPGSLHLRCRGEEIALQEVGAAGGQLSAGSEYRFYAPQPGDRWNAAEFYWLTVEAAPGLRMAERETPQPSAPVRDTAFQSGVYRRPVRYDSYRPGPTGDHWFSYEMHTDPYASPPYGSRVEVPLTPSLPLAAGPATITVTGSALTGGRHDLSITLGSAVARHTWSGAEDWTAAASLDSLAVTAALRLTPLSAFDSVLIDSIGWVRPVQLDFGYASGAFEGVAGTWTYRLTRVAGGSTLYDVTDAARPEILGLASVAGIYQDGPEPRRYLLSSPGNAAMPAIAAVPGRDFSPSFSADVIYIAPAMLHPALAPLIALRQAQGHAPVVVDVQAIYDGWSFGRVSPEAIRNFLRYAAGEHTHPPALGAAVLVGDGTYDPLEQSPGRPAAANLIPPYLAMADPWLGETACDNCYGRLDNPDPLSDALPDIEIGRLPVQDAASLQGLVSRLIAYAAPAAGLWRGRNIFLADNYREPVRDAAGTIIGWRADSAGDFAQASDTRVSQQPAGLDVRRLYYDPYPPTSAGVPWREPGALLAHTRTLQLLNDGAAIVNYIGHADASQLAYTDATPGSSVNYLLDAGDAGALANGNRLPVVLNMTCLTSAFHIPLNGDAALDERLVLAPQGGAIGVWGSSGLGVAYGHGFLHLGFYTALWASPGARAAEASLGELLRAGYAELFLRGNCCQESLHTFQLMGDPLTRLHAIIPTRAALPVVTHP